MGKSLPRIIIIVLFIFTLSNTDTVPSSKLITNRNITIKENELSKIAQAMLRFYRKRFQIPEESQFDETPMHFASKEDGVPFHREWRIHLEMIDIENFCFGNSGFLAFGPCASTFLKCHKFNKPKQYSFGECPLGEVFKNTECRPAYKIKACFNTEVNLLNQATEKLAQVTNFCARNPFGSVIYFVSKTNDPEHKCSRQALLCRSSGSPLAISCASDQVLNSENLRCEPAPDRCMFVSKETFAPIRDKLVQAYCKQNHVFEINPTKELEVINRCKNWYVTCDAHSPEMINCDYGKMYDPFRKNCRRVHAEDQCPLISACRGWEWRSASLGECRTDFLYCNGMRPIHFQCQEPGTVFKDSECVKPSEANLQCEICNAGDLKRAEKCNEFYQCTTNRPGSQNLKWHKFRCDNPRVFSPFESACVLPNEYNCPNRVKCQEGESYTVECGDFFYCYEGKFTSGKCPHMTRWDSKQRRCISDKNCHRFIVEKNGENRCQNGEAKPSFDCKEYDECVDGKFMKMSCQEYGTDRLKAPCRFCKSIHNNLDTYPVDTILPENFNPFIKQGFQQKQCLDGEKIVNRQDCGRYMECMNGEWFNFICPTGFSYFDPKSQACANAKNSAVHCEGIKPLNSHQNSLYLLPLYNASQTKNTLVNNVAGPIPQIPEQYKETYGNSFEFCDKNSLFRLSNPYDCAKYKECSMLNGGYYMEKQCPYATQFDPKQGVCKYDYLCVAPKCVEGLREPREECGKARRCKNNEWQNIRCKNQMAFINGKCSRTISCQNSNIQYPNGGGQCIHRHTKAHHNDCSKYLICNHGQYVEESCFNGHQFNPAIGRCDPSFKCQSTYQPPCYEGELRAVTNNNNNNNNKSIGNCEQYEVCADGKFVKQRCPFGRIFDEKSKQCKKGSCYQMENHDQSEKFKEKKKPEYNFEKCMESPGVDGFRTDEDNCSKFYQCAAGKWVPKDCPAGLAFSPSLGVCDWPQNVPGC